MLGFALAFLSLAVSFVYLVYKLLFWQNFAVGVAPVVIGLFLFCSVQLFFIGVLGEYIGAIHTQVLRRPHVVEKERLNFARGGKRNGQRARERLQTVPAQMVRSDAAAVATE